MKQPVNHYRYTIKSRLGTMIADPLGEGDFTIEWQREDDDKLDYEKNMSSKILFRFDPYQTLLKLNKSIYRCDLLEITIDRRCGTEWNTWLTGKMSLNDGEWDEYRCEVSIKLLELKLDQCFTDNKGTQIDIFQAVSTRYIAKTINPNITIEKVTYSEPFTGDNCTGEYLWLGTGNPTEQGYTVYYHDEDQPDEEHGCRRTTKWARQVLTVPCADPSPGSEWILLSDGCPGDDRVYAKPVVIYACNYQYPPVDSGLSGITMDCKILGDTGTLTQIDNGVHLRDVLNEFTNMFCAGITVKSNFFGINADNTPIGAPVYSGTTQVIASGFTIRVYGITAIIIKKGMILSVLGGNYTILTVTYVPSPGYHLFTVDTLPPSGVNPLTPWAIYNGLSGINYVTGAPSKTGNILIFQKSDVKRPTGTGNASKAKMTFEKLIKALTEMFWLKWRFENGQFRIEHVTWYGKNPGIDLTDDRYKKRVIGLQRYSYDNAKIPQREEYTFKESGSPDFVGLPIVYTGGCAAAGPKDNVVKHSVEDFTTDVQYCIDNPSSDSERVSDDGFVMMATHTDGTDYWIISEGTILGGSTLNNSLAWAQLHRDYHRYYRPLRSGIMNGVQTDFFSVQPTKQLGEITIPLCCGDNFNPDDTINTWDGPAVVSKATFSFNNEMLTLSLLRPADDGLVLNKAPIANHDTATTYQNVPVTVNVLANDTDPDGGGTIKGIEIVSQPSHGIAEVTADDKIKYTPTPGYNGDDYVVYRCFDDWTEYSNNALVTIIIYPPNQPPVANNDAYTSIMGNVLNVAAPGIFANDTDDVSFTLNGYTPTTTAGGTVVVNANGSFTYTPPSTSYYGVDTFTYTIKDGQNVVSAPATVTITVQNLTLPKPQNDSYTTIRNQILNVAAPGILANDTPGSNGVKQAVPATGTTASGATYTITAAGAFTYNPASGFTGTEVITYTATNGAGGTATATISVKVLPPIYVRLVVTNTRTVQNIIQCPGNTKAGYRRYSTYIAYFYQNSAATVPFDVTGLGLTLNIRNSQSDGTGGTTVYINSTGVASGSVFNIGELLVAENTTDCDGNLVYSTSISRTLAPGNYIII
jgi:hypothetical protein